MLLLIMGGECTPIRPMTRTCHLPALDERPDAPSSSWRELTSLGNYERVRGARCRLALSRVVN